MDNKRITALFRHLLELGKKHTTGGLKRRLIFVKSTLRINTELSAISREKFEFYSGEKDFLKCFLKPAKKV